MNGHVFEHTLAITGEAFVQSIGSIGVIMAECDAGAGIFLLECKGFLHIGCDILVVAEVCFHALGFGKIVVIKDSIPDISNIFDPFALVFRYMHYDMIGLFQVHYKISYA